MEGIFAKLFTKLLIAAQSALFDASFAALVGPLYSKQPVKRSGDLCIDIV